MPGAASRRVARPAPELTAPSLTVSYRSSVSTSLSDDTSRPAPTEPGAGADRGTGGRAWSAVAVLVAAGVTVAAWLPFLHAPLGSDESGFLLLAQHWRPGSSLYGDYWVDRPPLLLWLFSTADHLGPTRVTAAGVTAPGVKLLGAAASGAAVILAGILANLVAPKAGWSRRAAIVLAAALLSSPLFGMPETDGEVLAVPFVLLGVLCLLAALRRPSGRRAMLLAFTAGGSATAAALVKQNVIDVFVFAVVLAILSRGRVPGLGPRLAGFAGGATGVLAAAVAGAWVQGTTVAGLWDAIVVFRLQASGVIGSSASEATPARMTGLIEAFGASGAAAVLVVSGGVVLARVVRGRRPATQETVDPSLMPGPDLAWPVLAMVVWELCGVALGGSYWLHYLTGLVPGLVLMVAIARPGRWSKRVLTLTVAYAAVASLAVWGHDVATPAGVSSDAQVMSYLREHARPSDGVVVGFGHPDIVAGSELHSPYEHLWSLPVRVRDPRLTELRLVMAGPSAPRWIVVAGDSLDTWGLEADEAQQYLVRHYVEQVAYGDWHIWRRLGQRGGMEAVR
ncbi:hypothetical protein Noca_1558 [Nocardioides sp. JS614]|nr:hypothetical protein Noca_1558 [Nocardioides sp. JS614]